MKIEDAICRECLCSECNENYDNGGGCIGCDDCNNKPKSICPKGKFRNDYGDVDYGRTE